MIVDGDSSIDILFRNSLPALKLTLAQLKPYEANSGVFYRAKAQYLLAR